MENGRKSKYGNETENNLKTIMRYIALLSADALYRYVSEKEKRLQKKVDFVMP